MTWRKRTIMELAREVFDVQTDDRGRQTFSIDTYGIEAFAALVREENQTQVQRLSALVRAQKITIDKLEQALAQPEQSAKHVEPVAWMHTKLDGVVVPHRPADLDRHPDRWEALYKNTQPCPTCEALARTVMLDQTSHDTTPPQRTWVGLPESAFAGMTLQQVTAMKYAEQILKDQNT